MNKNNVLNVLKQCFETFIPAEDARTTVTPLALTINLVFFYLGDSKTFSLESIRRSMMSYLNKIDQSQCLLRADVWKSIETEFARCY